MTVTSFAFLLFLLIGMVLYYLAPRRGQWVVLLALSLAFYFFAATPYTIVYLIASTLIAYFSTNLMRSRRAAPSRARRRITGIAAVVAVALNAGLWFLLKGGAFWSAGFRLLHALAPAIPALPGWPYASAMGMGYYTAQVIGYILDCYWENAQPQRNPLKLFLFVCFFPQMTVGPISRYSQLQGLYEGHRFSYQNLCFGSQRILWGFFKKLVIADRAARFIDLIWAGDPTRTGVWPWIAALAYPLQFYADFSGCVDIALGAAELFDLRPPENFHNPFFSRTSQEFWQRWHITLGAWARDYVYYPALKSAPLQRIGKWAKKRFGKRAGKLLPWSLGLGILWFVMGLWHGSIQHILGLSLWYWAILLLSEILSPLFKRALAALKIDVSSGWWHLFQSARTYVLFALGVVFFSAPGLSAGIHRFLLLWKILFTPSRWHILNSGVIKANLAARDVALMLFGVACLFAVARLNEKGESARARIQRRPLPLRWLIWIGLSVIVLLFGMYGPGFDTQQFIYQGF